MNNGIMVMSHELKISIVVPIYKVESYIHQCIDSVLSQSYQNIEVVLVDDGSPDGCPQICDQYACADKRVTVIHQQNRGLSAARNAGVNRSEGDYITFLDSDDFWCDSDALKRLCERLRQSETDVLNYSYAKCSASGETIVKRFDGIKAMPLARKDPESQLAYLTAHTLYIASACNKLIRRELALRTPFEEGKTSEDIEWCARLMRDAASFDFVCENFYCYRQREGSITHSLMEKSCTDLTDNIIRCISITEGAPRERQPFLWAYTAYQLATFIAVQALAANCPKACIDQLRSHQSILHYCNANTKVRLMDYGCRLIGFANMCRVSRLTKSLWKQRK